MPPAPRRWTKAELLGLLRARLSPLSDAPRFLGSDHAAVVMLVTLVGGGIEVLFAKRSVDPKDPWSGQVAFPGGRSKEIDATLMRTACREFFEETYFDICKKAEMLGFLQTVNPRNRPNITVTPFVAYAERKFVFTPSREVSDIFWAPLSDLRKEEVDIALGDDVFRVPAYVYEGHIVWGLTAHILDGFIELTRSPPAAV